jgi:hypothetical protein
MINLDKELKSFFISLRTIGFTHVYLTYDDSLFLKVVVYQNKIATYEITIHKKPCGYTLVFVFNSAIEYRTVDKSIPVFVEKMKDFLKVLYDRHEELLTF